MDTQKIVISTAPDGRFGLSQTAAMWLWLMKCKYTRDVMPILPVESDNAEIDPGWAGNDHLCGIARDNPLLIKCVETFGQVASGNFARLEIVEIPVSDRWMIGNMGGVEYVATIKEFYTGACNGSIK